MTELGPPGGHSNRSPRGWEPALRQSVGILLLARVPDSGPGRGAVGGFGVFLRSGLQSTETGGVAGVAGVA